MCFVVRLWQAICQVTSKTQINVLTNLAVESGTAYEPTTAITLKSEKYQEDKIAKK